MRPRKIIWIVILAAVAAFFLLAAAGTVVTFWLAGPKILFQLGCRSEENGEIKMAAWFYKQAAAMGNEKAAEYLLDFYIDGLTSKSDHEAILKILAPRAEKGDARAQFLLGLMHERGCPGEKDFKKAAEWYQKAIDQGFRPAFIGMGRLWIEGRLGEKNYEKAFEMFSKAAEKGYPGALAELGYDLYWGNDIEKDVKKAVTCLKKASEEKNVFAMNNLAYIYAETGEGSLDDAEKLILEALKKMPNDPCFLDTLGYVFYKKGKFLDALEQFRKADNLADMRELDAKGASEIKTHVADAYEKLGDAAKAKQYRDEAEALAKQGDKEEKESDPEK